MRSVAWNFCVILLLLSNAASQEQTKRDSLPTLTPISVADSARLVKARPGTDTASVGYTPTKKPGVALLFSAVLPGAGQFYNESYWKIPILVGFGYYLASQWIDNNDSTKHYRDLFTKSITSELPSGNSQYQLLREFYKDQRDMFSWYFFIYYIVNLVDAYVDASLYDFNVGEDLSIRVTPSFNAMPVQRVGVNLQIRF